MSSPSSDQALSEQSLGWLDGLDSAFEQAAANGIAEHSYSIAGRPLLVRFAGRAMADRFMPALEHLQSKQVLGLPDLRAERGLAYMTRSCRSAEMFVVRYGYEIF